MKKFRKMTALLSAMTVTICGISGGFCTAADDTETTGVKISFNITEDMSPALKTDITLFEDTVTTSANYGIPKGTFTKEGYVFSGWTVDGIEGFLSGETYVIPEGTDEVVFEPVWYNPKSTDIHNITYNLDFHGEIIEYPDWLKDSKASAGQIVTPDYTEIQIDGAYTHGLTIMDGYKLSFGCHFVMPDEDVVVTPTWYKIITFTYFAGDVDRLNGNNIHLFPKNEGSNTDLPNSDRFSRDGFNLVGWLSDYDGKIYKPLAIVTCPDVDVTFTAVWEPKTYNVVFRQGNGGANLKVEGVTDTQIICPEPNITVDGKYFAGWKTESGEIYQAGSEYTILGAKPGAGIMLTAVWETGEPPVTTTAEPTTGESSGKTFIGDANEDGQVDIADATAIIQHMGNPDEYALSEQGKINADIVNQGDGVTGADAVALQLIEAKKIKQSELPITMEQYNT
ncbi:MAG: dockerin type I repeat-containing protein, partial [Ruminococcus sp.]|nr:dockerin type I repeat-containing protein [Ruminococcus sp.]